MITDITKTTIALSHISVDYAFFNVRDKALMTMGRYLFEYTLVIIIFKTRKNETDTFLP